MSEWKKFTKFVKSRSSVAVRDQTLESYIAQMKIMQKKYGLKAPKDYTKVLENMEGKVSAATLNYRRYLLKIWLEFHGVQVDKTHQNLLKYKRGKRKRKLHSADLLTMEEILNIVKRTQSPSLRAYFMCLYDTGARPNELCQMNVSDVEQLSHTYAFTFRTTKNEQSRRTARLLVPQTIRYFEQWWSIHPERNNLDAPLFISHRGTRVEGDSTRNLLKKQHEKRLARGKHGGKAPLTLYLFRKSRITHLLREGRLTPIQIKLRIGHKMHSNVLEEYYAILTDIDQANAEDTYLGIKTEEEPSKLITCPNCGAPNDTNTASCLRCKLPMTQEELIHQHQILSDELTLKIANQIMGSFIQMLKHGKVDLPDDGDVFIDILDDIRDAVSNNTEQ